MSERGQEASPSGRDYWRAVWPILVFVAFLFIAVLAWAEGWL